MVSLPSWSPFNPHWTAGISPTIEVANWCLLCIRMSNGKVVCGPGHNEPIVATMNEGLAVATVIEWTLHCEDETVKLSVRRIFGSLAEAEEFYICYARLAGFCVRKERRC